MVVWIDIGHVAQLNFYVNAIRKISESAFVHVSILNRGRLFDIALKELPDSPNIRLQKIGAHHGSLVSSVIESNFLRLIKLFFYYGKIKPKILITNEFLATFVGKTMGLHVISFGDDIERRWMVRIKRFCSTEVYYAFSQDSNNKNFSVDSFNALKEWAYLSPKYFEPNPDILKYYGIVPNGYLFVREISTGTINYRGQDHNTISKFAKEIPNNIEVLLSLEKKTTASLYPDTWKILEEPLPDIHSLLYYSRMVISSGDSMAREGAMLGVPSLYCGVRFMNANNVLIKKNMLFHREGRNALELIKSILKGKVEIKNQEGVIRELLNEWDDPTEIIMNRYNKIRDNIK